MGSAVGFALKYERTDLLPLLLKPADNTVWEQLVNRVLQPPSIAGGIGAGVWVKIKGKRAKTSSSGKRQVPVQFPDCENPQKCSGPATYVDVQELTVLPALPQASKDALARAAVDAGCPESTVAKLNALEDGHYGVEPREIGGDK